MELNLTNLEKYIESFDECIQAYKTNKDIHIQGFIEDSCVKRFEYTVETSWKIMKKLLKLQYGKDDKELTMNNIFRLMEGYAFIKSWQAWREYYDRRNDTSHEYNQIKSKKILEISDKFLEDCNYLYKQLKKSIEA